MRAHTVAVVALTGSLCLVGISACSDDGDAGDTSPSSSTPGETSGPTATSRVDGTQLAAEADVDVVAVLVASGLDPDDATCVSDGLIERFGDISAIDTSSPAIQEAIGQIGGECAAR